jgi:hypothetical protein
MTITTEDAEECARGQDSIEEASTFPGYRSIANRCAATLRSLAAERDALRAERNMLKRDNEIMVGMINDMGTIFIKARAALGEKE